MEVIKEIKDRLRKALMLRDMSQQDLADITGIPKSSISQYISGYTKPKADRIYLMAKALSVKEAWLLGYDVDMERDVSPHIPTEHGVKIPVLGHVAAGIPISAIEDILDWEEISQESANTGQYFGLQIKGDSMEPRILDGDVVIVRSQPTAETGDIVIAQVNGDEATCKKLLMQSDGLSLLSFNTKYDPMVFTAAEVESKPVRIIGKVIELRAKF